MTDNNDVANDTTETDTLRAQLEEQKQLVEKLKEESIGNRLKAKESKKREYAVNQVLKKNNIKFDVNQVNLEAIQIDETGSPTGEINYSPERQNKPGVGVPPTSQGKSGGLSIEDIGTMSRGEIAKNWDEVLTVLQSNSNSQ